MTRGRWLGGRWPGARWLAAATAVLAAAAAAARAEERSVAVDLSRHSPASPISIVQQESSILVRWPAGRLEEGRLALDLGPGKPLISSLGIEAAPEEGATPALAFEVAGLDPVFFLTVGSRRTPGGRPPGMDPFNVFFDKPASRPHETHASRLDLERVDVSSRGERATLSLASLDIGSFRGKLEITVYAGSRLVHVEAAVATREEMRAVIYDAGVTGALDERFSAAWLEPGGGAEVTRVPLDPATPSRPIAVRHRTVVLEGSEDPTTPPRVAGSIAIFPPPHQFHYPRDWSDNFRYVWAGAGHHGLAKGPGLGVRQDPEGRRGERFVPWFNAPPGTVQRLGVFLLPVRGRAETALDEALRFTRGDRFRAIPGHITFTSHWHMAVAVAAMERKARGDASVPDFVKVFKDMGVNAVHLGDFHGDGHQKDPGPLRLPELDALFEECRKLSDAELLMIPGEEVNDFLGIKEEGKHPGHWMSLFPRPVYWTLQRPEGRPFEEAHPERGRIYHVGSRADMVELLRREGGLAWAAHPRIKASSWTPDIFRGEDFYLADSWLGGAWKPMPGDLSRERLGERVLDLLDDMANWGQRKYVLGEVDVFKIDRTHELFGHMNVNYLKLDRLPRFDDGWQPILDALRAGRFFTTTGEVLIHRFHAGGKESGEVLELKGEGPVEIEVELEWTFPLRFLEVISGDGKGVRRERTDAPDTRAFGKRTWTLRSDLAGRKWVRLEAWDIATNGAFTQPVWIEPAGG